MYKSVVKEKQKKKDGSNETGIPTQMKQRYEALSGFSFDDVRVHYNSDKPAQLQALAYTQGNQVYVAPGQEKHLVHELGHVVQQMQGRVKPTIQLQGVNVNNDAALEDEADSFGDTIQGDFGEDELLMEDDAPLQLKPMGFVQRKLSDKVAQLRAWVISRDLTLGLPSSSSNRGSSSSRGAVGHNGGGRGSSYGSYDSSGGSLAVSISPSVSSSHSSNSSTASRSRSRIGSKMSTSSGKLNPKKESDCKAEFSDQLIANDDTKSLILNTMQGDSKWKKIRTLKLHHRHILFSELKKLPKGKKGQDEMISDNIGYGGVLYREKSLSGYVKNNEITVDPVTDDNVIAAINKKKDFGEYNAITNNCQHWVNEVVKESKNQS